MFAAVKEVGGLDVQRAVAHVNGEIATALTGQPADPRAIDAALIALDGTTEIRTPHDDCLLVMPSLRPSRGHTAVRLARIVT